jgi:hypothetical protein
VQLQLGISFPPSPNSGLSGSCLPIKANLLASRGRLLSIGIIDATAFGMRLNFRSRLFAASLLGALFWIESTQAAPVRRRSALFFLDGAGGIAIPIGDSNYVDSFYPSPRLGLRLGAEIWITRHIGLAPEFALDGGPLFGKRSNAVTTGSLRFQPGLRVLFGFGRGHAFFLRYLIGGEAFIFGPGGRGGVGTTDVGFATEPGIGMQFRIGRHAVAGFTAGFPIALHSFGTSSTSVNADFEASGFVGLRI